jgi:hypothetical protein
MREAVPARLVRHWQTSAASAGEDAWRVGVEIQRRRDA